MPWGLATDIRSEGTGIPSMTPPSLTGCRPKPIPILYAERPCAPKPPDHRFMRAESSISVRANAANASRRSEEHTSELQSLMRISYAVFCLKKKKKIRLKAHTTRQTEEH